MFSFGEPFDSSEWRYCTRLTTESVMRAWQAVLEHEALWQAMTRDDRTGYIGTLVHELLDLVDGLDDLDRRHRIERIARRHGAFRRGQLCTALVVANDFAALRHALRDALFDTGAAPGVIRQAMRYLLPDWRRARSAAHAGFCNALRDEVL